MADTTTSAAPATRPPRAPRAARPAAMRGHPYAGLLTFVVVLGLLRFAPAWNSEQASVFDNWIYLSILAVGFYFVFGVSGQFAFSQAAFAMVGGYTSAWATREGIDWVPAVVLGMLAAAVIAVAFSYLARRANLFFFAIATLALSQILSEIVAQWTGLTGQVGGAISLNASQRIDLFGWTVTSEDDLFWVYAVSLVLVLLIGTWLARSPVKREAIAFRDGPIVAATLGVPTLRVRITMFVLGSCIAAFAGSLNVHGRLYASPSSFGVELGLGVFVVLIVGGIGSIWGPILGAAFYEWLPYVLKEINVDVLGKPLSSYTQIIYGAALLLFMIFLPQGLIGILDRGKTLLGQRGATGSNRRRQRTWLSDLFGISSTPPAAAEPAHHRPTAPATTPSRSLGSAVTRLPSPEPSRAPILRAVDIGVSFGGVRAVDGVTLDLHEAEILGLIGPNGSGKTTFLNALTGVVPATGSLHVAGSDVPLGVPGRSRRYGILRTYQAPQTYDHLSCLDDVLLSTADRNFTGLLASALRRPAMLGHDRVRWDTALAALSRVGLADKADESAGRLTYGQRRLLELARAIAAGPRVLLLDEPSAGLDASETDTLAGHLADLRTDGMSLLVIDHKLDFMTRLCDRIAVLEQGSLVVVSDAATVFDDHRVVDAYLGVAGTD